MGELVMDLRHLSIVHREIMFDIKFSNPSSLCSSQYCGAEKIKQRLKNQILGYHCDNIPVYCDYFKLYLSFV